VFRFQRDGFENQQVERSLYEIVWFAHTLTIYNNYLSIVKVSWLTRLSF
jgi:hypothetical protein